MRSLKHASAIGSAVVSISLCATVASSGPMPPCIATGVIFGSPLQQMCSVRNVGSVPHAVSWFMVDNHGFIVSEASEVLAPGASDTNASGGGGASNSFACVAFTKEGNAKALEDLAVVFFLTDTQGNDTAQTEGTIHPSCATPMAPPGTAP